MKQYTYHYIHTKVDKITHDKIKEKAKQQDSTMSQIIRVLVKKYLSGNIQIFKQDGE